LALSTSFTGAEMPVVVTTPVQGEAVGPGTFVRASTQSVLPIGHHWDALLFQPGTQDILVDALNLTEGQSTELVLGRRQVQPGQFEPIFAPQLAQPVTGGEYELHVRVISAQSTILDTSGPIGIQWRPEPWGTAYIQSLQSTVTGEGGFTEEDRVVMGTIQAATYASIPVTTVGGSAVQLGLEQLLKGPPIDFLAQSSEFLISGRTSINRPGNAVGTLAYGYRWRIETAPAGLGKLDGQVVEYEQRIAQFAVIKTRVGGGEYVAQLQNSHDASGEATWGLPFPVRVDFDILPGVVVRFAWLLFAQ